MFRYKSRLFCYLPRKRKEMEGDRRERRWVGETERHRSYQDNLLTAERCNLCLNKHRGPFSMTPETPLTTLLTGHTHMGVMRKVGSVYQ